MIINRLIACTLLILPALFMPNPASSQSYQNKEGYVDAIKSKVANLSFYCKEKLEAVPNNSLLKQKFPEIFTLTSDSTIDSNLTGRHFTRPLKQVLIQRAKIRYECSIDRSQALSGLGSRMGILYDLIQHDMLANSLLLISQNADAYTFMSSQQLLGKTRLETLSQLGQQANSGQSDYDSNLRKETIEVDDHLNRTIEQLDALVSKMRTNRNFTCESVGPYRVCFN